MSRDNRNDPTDYAVICLSGCGLQFITAEQELEGLKKPDAPWRCPRCGGHADWDDDCRATNPPEDAVSEASPASPDSTEDREPTMVQIDAALDALAPFADAALVSREAWREADSSCHELGVPSDAGARAEITQGQLNLAERVFDALENGWPLDHKSPRTHFRAMGRDARQVSWKEDKVFPPIDASGGIRYYKVPRPWPAENIRDYGSIVFCGEMATAPRAASTPWPFADRAPRAG